MKKTSHVDLSQASSLQHSLTAIKEAHVQLHLLTATTTSPTALASQIQLCEVLLGEISGIRSSLARSLEHRRNRPRGFVDRPGLHH
jgi:hypothetical protein